MPFGPAGSTAYVMEGPTASAALVGSVQGVVVQASAWTPASCRESSESPALMGNVTVTVWSWRFL